jgi:cell division septation protein DedD
VKKILKIFFIMIWSISFTASAHAQNTSLGKLNDEVINLYYQERYAEAAKVAEKALKVAEKSLGPEHLQVATFQNNLAIVYYAQGKYAEAGALYNRALSITENALGPTHPRVVTVSESMAECYKKLGRVGEAEILERQARIIRSTKDKSPQPLKPLKTTFTVQAGSFNDLSRAKDLERRLDKKGYDAHITLSGIKERKLYKVYIGKFADREKAEILSEKIKKTEDLHTFVTLW